MENKLTNEQILMLYECPNSKCAAKKICIKYNDYRDFLQRLVDHYYITFDPMTHKQIADIAKELLRE